MTYKIHLVLLTIRIIAMKKNKTILDICSEVDITL